MGVVLNGSILALEEDVGKSEEAEDDMAKWGIRRPGGVEMPRAGIGQLMRHIQKGKPRGVA